MRFRLAPTLLLLLLLLHALADEAPPPPSALAELDAAASQPAALALFADGADGRLQPGEECMLLALERGWWEVAKRILRRMRERGEPVASMADVRSAATTIRDQATEIITLMRTGANTEETVVSTAFQWAQRPEFVYLNVKFSSRIDGPVTCLNVDNEKVTFYSTLGADAPSRNSLLFQGVGRQKPKTFRLNLTFFEEIDAALSNWSFASVGRMSFTIAKKKAGMWPRLLEGKTKPKNMHAWYDRQVALDAELEKKKKEAKEAKEAKEKDSKEAEEKAKDGPKAPPPAAPPDAKSSDAAPKKKKDAKKKKSKKASAKDSAEKKKEEL
jgi:hypothetical protein